MAAGASDQHFLDHFLSRPRGGGWGRGCVETDRSLRTLRTSDAPGEGPCGWTGAEQDLATGLAAEQLVTGILCRRHLSCGPFTVPARHVPAGHPSFKEQPQKLVTMGDIKSKARLQGVCPTGGPVFPGCAEWARAGSFTQPRLLLAPAGQPAPPAHPHGPEVASSWGWQ